jgi:TrmH family RNA methyltransferase
MTSRTTPILTSVQNPRVKALVKLRHPRERRRTGLTRVDGARELQRALEVGLVPEVVFVCPARLRDRGAVDAVAAALAQGASRQDVTEEVYTKIRYGDRDEGLCAPLAWAPRGLEELALPANPFLVVLEGVEKPGNLGGILRTADAAGADAVLLCDPALDAANPNVVRASMGTIFTVAVATASTERVQAVLRERAVTTVAAVVEDTRSYTDVDATGPVALVLGAEHAGLSNAWREAADQRVRIPMAGHADSLNLGAAAAILMFEVVRQRRQVTTSSEASFPTE